MERLLIIDDEEMIRKVLTIHLSKAGYEVIGAQDGKEGSEYFRGK